jgi:hypothetical protein
MAICLEKRNSIERENVLGPRVTRESLTVQTLKIEPKEHTFVEHLKPSTRGEVHQAPFQCAWSERPLVSQRNARRKKRVMKALRRQETLLGRFGKRA